MGLVGGPAMASCCNAVVLPSSGSAEVGEDTNQHRRRSRQSNFSAAATLQEAPVREPRNPCHLLLSIVDESSSYLVGPDWQTKFEVRWRHSGAASVAFLLPQTQVCLGQWLAMATLASSQFNRDYFCEAEMNFEVAFQL